MTTQKQLKLEANGTCAGEGFPGETFEVTSGAGRKTYTIVATDPFTQAISLKPGKSSKRTIRDLAAALSNTGVLIDGHEPRAWGPLPDPFGRLDKHTIRVSFQSPVVEQTKHGYGGKIESNTVKFKVVRN